MVEEKIWWKSRTIWSAVISLVYAVLAFTSNLPEGLTQESALEAVMVITSALAVVFRVQAKETIKLTQE